MEWINSEGISQNLEAGPEPPPLITKRGGTGLANGRRKTE